jgi:hypothetical protein
MNFTQRILDNEKASSLFAEWERAGGIPSYSGEDDELRDRVLSIPNGLQFAHPREGNERARYLLDVQVGIELYKHLEPSFLDLRNAANDGFWKYMSMIVLPDIVYQRWQLNKDRYWARTNRIWLKTVWWYVHLSWQEDLETTKTYLLAKNLSTDTVVQLVERAGRHGYRVALYRCIMKRLVEEGLTQDEFRALMTLNTVMTATVEPALYEGGVSRYVNWLVKRVRIHP